MQAMCTLEEEAVVGKQRQKLMGLNSFWDIEDCDMNLVLSTMNAKKYKD